MISMAPADVTRRLRHASDASDLTTDRLATKIDMSPDGVTARLREVADLYAACVALRATPTPRGAGPAAQAGRNPSTDR